jgi:hypothetical protein
MQRKTHNRKNFFWMAVFLRGLRSWWSKLLTSFEEGCVCLLGIAVGLIDDDGVICS